MELRQIDLFAGIGGLALAGEWAGFTHAAFVEINPFCQKVLTKNFPGVPIHDDINTFDAAPFRGQIAVISGGFPCQDVASVNKYGQGLDGERSGLWFRMLDIIKIVRPPFVVAENVHTLVSKGLDRVLSGLEEAGYTAEAFVLGASDVGAPHERKRVFVVAYADGFTGLQAAAPVRSLGTGRDAREDALRGFRRDAPGTDWAVYFPGVNGVDDGFPDRVDRVTALGNAVCPQQVYPFFAAIAERLTAQHDAPASGRAGAQSVGGGGGER